MKVLTASFALFALAAPSAFAVFCTLDSGQSDHSHSKAPTKSESHHHGSDHESDSSDSHHGHDSDQDAESDECCQKLIGSGNVLIVTTATGLAIPTYTDHPAMLSTSPVLVVQLSEARDPGFYSQDSGPPFGRPPSSNPGRAPPVLVA